MNLMSVLIILFSGSISFANPYESTALIEGDLAKVVYQKLKVKICFFY